MKAPSYAYVEYKNTGRPIIQVSMIQDFSLKDVNAVVNNTQIYLLPGDEDHEGEEGFYDGDVVMVNIGHGCWIDKDRWTWINAAKTDSQFTRELVRYLWDTATLKNRSVTGSACQYKPKDGAQAKLALTPEKLIAVRSAYGAYVRGHTSEKRPEEETLKALNKHLASMLRDMH